MNDKQSLPAGVIMLMLVLCLLWGGNMVAIKFTVGTMPPIFAAAARSLVSGLLVALLMKARGVKLFPSREATIHGAVCGILFGLEFACIYLGLKFTLATRTSILLYTHPFFVAIGAHYVLHSDKLHGRKAFGLALAFTGILVLFVKDWGPATLATLPGDLLILAGAAGWAATTLYIKRYLTAVANPLQVLFYQLGWSFPLLLIISLIFEKSPNPTLTNTAWLSFGYQCVIIAFMSYVLWFELIHRYSVSLLAAFTFFTPVFGVLLSSLLLPNEQLRPAVLISLVLVCTGTILVNRPPKAVPGK